MQMAQWFAVASIICVSAWSVFILVKAKSKILRFTQVAINIAICLELFSSTFPELSNTKTYLMIQAPFIYFPGMIGIFVSIQTIIFLSDGKHLLKTFMPLFVIAGFACIVFLSFFNFSIFNTMFPFLSVADMVKMWVGYQVIPNILMPGYFLYLFFTRIDDELNRSRMKFIYRYVAVFTAIFIGYEVYTEFVLLYAGVLGTFDRELAFSLAAYSAYILMAFNFAAPLLLSFGPGKECFLDPKGNSTMITSPDVSAQVREADLVKLEELKAVMNEQEVYRDPLLNVQRLAGRLELSEFQLRRLINSYLGYRNFNSYLNEYRIAEAKKCLGNPTNADQSISAIGFSVGYSSIATFNRVFKDLVGQSPGEFRKQGGELKSIAS